MKTGDTYYWLSLSDSIIAVRLHAIFPHLASCDVVMPNRSIQQLSAWDLFATEHAAEEARLDALARRTDEVFAEFRRAE